MAFNVTVQKLSVSVALAGGETFTIPAPVDIDRSIVLATSTNSSAGLVDGRMMVSARLVNSTTLEMFRGQGGGAASDCIVYIVEFAAGDGVSVQRTFGIGPHTVIAVDAARTIPILSQSAGTSASLNCRGSSSAYLSDTTTLQVENVTASAFDQTVDLVEFPVSVDVQMRTGTMGTSDTSATFNDFTAFDPDTSIALCYGYGATNAEYWTGIPHFAEIVNSTTVTVQRGGTAGAVIDLWCYVVDLGVPVLTESIAVGDAVTAVSQSLPAGSATRTPFPHPYAAQGAMLGSAGQDTAAKRGFLAELNAGNTAVDFTRITAGGTPTILAMTIDWEGGVAPVGFPPWYIAGQGVAA